MRHKPRMPAVFRVGWRLIVTVGLAVSLLTGCQPKQQAATQQPLLPPTSPAATSEPPTVAKFDDQGRLLRPTDYREWVHVGSPVTPNDMNGGKALFPEFHEVYIDRPSYEHYQRTGEFRDGTVIVKELESVGAKSAPSGKGYFPGKRTAVAASMRDTQRWPEDQEYWAFFNFGQEPSLAEAAEAQPEEACFECHRAAGQEAVFTQYYPVLQDARAAAAGG